MPGLGPLGVLAALSGALASAALLVGALLVMRRRPSARTIGLVMGFGAGALISSIAYELVPATLAGGGWLLAFAFATGAIIFFVSDWWVDQRGGANRKDIQGSSGDSGTTIFLGSLLDGVPESLILGIGLGLGGVISLAFLLAVFISNVPEGMAGTINLESAGRSRNTILFMWSIVLLASAVSAGLGYLFVQTHPGVDGRYAQAFAAGALLTMLADAMMPEAFEHGGKVVGLLTVMGFLLAGTLSALE